MKTTSTGIEINFTRINNDINGNPRYVCHFLDLLTDKDTDQIKEDYAASLHQNPFLLTGFRYELALERAKRIGGRKYNTKSYGGGIVFQSYNTRELGLDIIKLANGTYQG